MCGLLTSVEKLAKASTTSFLFFSCARVRLCGAFLVAGCVCSQLQKQRNRTSPKHLRHFSLDLESNDPRIEGLDATRVWFNMFCTKLLYHSLKRQKQPPQKNVVRCTVAWVQAMVQGNLRQLFSAKQAPEQMLRMSNLKMHHVQRNFQFNPRPLL